MTRNKCFVIDTNVLISAMISSHSVLRHALDKAFEEGTVIFSTETLSELAEKIFDKKFDRYVPLSERNLFLHQLISASELLKVEEQILLCRDPKDDKFLALAKTANATAIVSGDKDLLVLKSFENIPIVTPNKFLKLF